MADHKELIAELRKRAEAARAEGNIGALCIPGTLAMKAADALEEFAREWTPIESAPKDGTFILAVVYGFTPAVAQWTTDFRPEGGFEFLEPGMFAEESHWEAMLEVADPWKPTHWMPLPSAPNSQKDR